MNKVKNGSKIQVEVSRAIEVDKTYGWEEAKTLKAFSLILLLLYSNRNFEEGETLETASAYLGYHRARNHAPPCASICSHTCATLHLTVSPFISRPFLIIPTTLINISIHTLFSIVLFI